VTTNAKTAALEALIEAHAIELKLPTVRRRFRAFADEATRAQQTPVAYLAALLEAVIAERAERRERRRLIDARFPALKRLEDFRFTDNPGVPQATIAALAEGSWIDDRESVILIGDSGTGKTHLATALVSHPEFDGDFDARVFLVEGVVCHAESEEVSGRAVGSSDAVGVRVGTSDRARRC